MTESTSAPMPAGRLRREAKWLLAGITAVIGAAAAGVGTLQAIEFWLPGALAAVDRLQLLLWIAGLATAMVSIGAVSAAARWQRHGMISGRTQRTTEALVLLLLTVVTFTIWYFWIDYRARHGEDTSHVWVTGYLMLSSCGMFALLCIRRWRAGRSIWGRYGLIALAGVAATVAGFFIVVAPLLIGAMLLGLFSPPWGSAPGVEAALFAIAVLAHVGVMAVLQKAAGRAQY